MLWRHLDRANWLLERGYGVYGSSDVEGGEKGLGGVFCCGHGSVMFWSERSGRSSTQIISWRDKGQTVTSGKRLWGQVNEIMADEQERRLIFWWRLRNQSPSNKGIQQWSQLLAEPNLLKPNRKTPPSRNKLNVPVPSSNDLTSSLNRLKSIYHDSQFISSLATQFPHLPVIGTPILSFTTMIISYWW